jgi:hypothetical protein
MLLRHLHSLFRQIELPLRLLVQMRLLRQLPLELPQPERRHALLRAKVLIADGDARVGEDVAKHVESELELGGGR